MAITSIAGIADDSPYLVRSRREVLSLLRAMHEQGQLVSMQAGAGDAIVTSVLDVDEDSGLVVIDRAPGNLLNQRILESNNVNFSTVLDNIRILFHSDKVGECLYDGRPALYIPLPGRMARLQRREHYRVATPVVSPLRCTIDVPADERGQGGTTLMLSVKDISGGGVCLVDEKKLLDNSIGRIYQHCRIELPGAPAIVCKLQVRNSQDLILTSGKNIRKIGCMFIDLAPAVDSAIQRYITRLERERNAKATGLS